MARPTKYTRELGLKICARLFDGRSLRAICREDSDMPATSTIFIWLGRYPEFKENYTRAKEAAEEMLSEAILDIADDQSQDFYIDKDKNGLRKPNNTKLTRDRMRIDTRKWYLARIASKKFQKAQAESYRNRRDPAPPQISTEQFMTELDEIRLKTLTVEILEAEKISGLEHEIEDDGSDLC